MKPLLERSQKEIREALRKLEKALRADVGELPACNFAGITKEEYDIIIERHPDIKKLAERAGDVLGVKASMNIADAIEQQDVKVSQWYKEHTDPKFSKKMKVEGNVSLSAEEREQAIEQLLDELHD